MVRDERSGKYYDVFARAGDHLLAIDDVVAVLALVTPDEGSSELVVLEADGASFRVAARHPLPGPLDRFVR